MKIRDIILENNQEQLLQFDELWDHFRKEADDPKDKEFFLNHANKEKVRKLMKKNLRLMMPQAIGKVANASKSPAPEPKKRTPGTSSAPRTASTPQDQRDRQDTMGRNLRHDRYYRDKPEKPSPLDYTDNVFGDPNVIDKIPGVKQTKKVAKDAEVHAKTGSRVAKKAQNFDDTGKRVKKIGSRR